LSVYTASHSAAYKQQSILTATPGQLVVMLYDGCLRFLNQAAHAMREGNGPETDARLQRAEAIIDELLSTLDLEQGGVIASRLQGIYVFCSRHLLEARAARDPEMIDRVAELLAELRDSWAQVATA
jgi:flagellar protein FliS